MLRFPRNYFAKARCDSCRRVFEFTRSTEGQDTECPHCGATTPMVDAGSYWSRTRKKLAELVAAIGIRCA